MCEMCGHYPCMDNCPNYKPFPMYKCAECGEDLYVGNTAYKIGESYYCEDCCEMIEVERPEEDFSDYLYDEWKDRQREEAFG